MPSPFSPTINLRRTRLGRTRAVVFKMYECFGQATRFQTIHSASETIFYERYPKATHDLMFGLIEMNEDPGVGPELKRLLGVSSLMLATSQQYEPVRAMFRALKKKEESR